MSSQMIPTSFASPPRKRSSKKSKRRSSNDDDTARSMKAQRVKGDYATASMRLTAGEYRDEPQLPVAASQEPRRSGRAGAGSGGKTQQLEKLGALFDERAVPRVHRSTDLPPDTAANPLAPPAKRGQSGRRGGGKRAALDGPPPPYVPSGPDEVQAQPEVTPPTPVFHQRSSQSDRFGFSAPTGVSQLANTIVPPGLSVAIQDPLAQTKLRSMASSGTASQQPSPAGSIAQVVPAPSRALQNNLLPSRKESVSSRTLEQPAVSNPSLPYRKEFVSFASSHHSQQYHRTQAIGRAGPGERSDDGSSESEETSGSERSDEDAMEHNEGWGSTNSRQVAHPGFSKESQPNNTVRHVSLPVEHEFQFSRDEDDQMAQRNLDHAEFQAQRDEGVDAPDCHQTQTVNHLNGESQHGDTVDAANRYRQTIDNHLSQHGDAVDVLNRHHQINGRPSAPDAQVLTAPQPVETQEAVRTRAPRNSKKPKDAGPLPHNLGFYPAVWQDCLEDAKRECRSVHMLSNNPFPSKSRDLRTSITEALTTTIGEWNDDGAVFEPNYWPNHKHGMACVLLGDMSTWRSELKSTAFAVAPVAYKLIPPQDIMLREKVQWVQNSVTGLLADSLFLRDGVDEQGKTNNFAHPALKEVILRFFYTGSYRVADKRPYLFSKSVPVACVALAGAALNCVLDGFAKNGVMTLKAIPQFSGKEYRSIFLAMVKMLNEILRHPYHGDKLRKQLDEWALEGWAALHQVDVDVERGNHLQLLLD